MARPLLNWAVAIDKFRFAICATVDFPWDGKEEHSASEISITRVVAWLRGVKQYVSFALQRSRRLIPAFIVAGDPQQHRE
jgi:hypothetical protein